MFSYFVIAIGLFFMVFHIEILGISITSTFIAALVVLGGTVLLFHFENSKKTKIAVYLSILEVILYGLALLVNLRIITGSFIAFILYIGISIFDGALQFCLLDCALALCKRYPLTDFTRVLNFFKGLFIILYCIFRGALVIGLFISVAPFFNTLSLLLHGVVCITLFIIPIIINSGLHSAKK